MCPYYKLQWFEDRNYSVEDIAAVKTLVHSMFEWMTNSSALPQESQDSSVLDSGSKNVSRNYYLFLFEFISNVFGSGAD